MPSLASHHSAKTTKLLLIGDSGAGKTGSICSLAAAGYNVRILDLDNGIDIVKSYLSDPNSSYNKLNPKSIENVQYQTFTEKMKNINGRILPASATVWTRTISALADWKEKDPETGVETKLGPITSWTDKEVLVIDSLSFLATAALNFHLSMNGALMAVRTQNEARRDIGAAQNLLRDLLSMLYDSSVKCNVIVTSHITFVNEMGNKPGTEGDAMSSGISQGYPSAIGRALSPHIPRYFNSVLVARATGIGSGQKHKIFTGAQVVGGQVINAKSSAPSKIKSEYPLETGLADYLKAIQEA